MMKIKDILNKNCIKAKANITSAKTALTLLAELLGEQCPSVGSDKILDGLLARERLGSTSVGHGVAIPHAKLSSVTTPMLALLTADEGVDFSAPDNELVDIFFALILPEEDEGEHLKSLSCVSQLIREEAIRRSIRAAQESDDLFLALTESED